MKGGRGCDRATMCRRVHKAGAACKGTHHGKGEVYKTDHNAPLKSDILIPRMSNTSERREITGRVNAKEAETMQESKELVAKTKRFSAIADSKNLARRTRERKGPPRGPEESAIRFTPRAAAFEESRSVRMGIWAIQVLQGTSCTSGRMTMRVNGSNKAVLTCVVACAIALLFGPVRLQAHPFQDAPPAQNQPPAQNPPPAQDQPQPAQLTPQQLQEMVAPIALYPDALVAQILAASAYPTQIVEAERFLQQNPNLKGAELGAEVDKQDWDPSVKALTQFPSVLADMDKNLSWTSALGDANYNQQAAVMDAVQFMRDKAQEAGNLKTTPQQTVTAQGSTIVIQPANPQIVYVPDYDPATGLRVSHGALAGLLPLVGSLGPVSFFRGWVWHQSVLWVWLGLACLGL